MLIAIILSVLFSNKSNLTGHTRTKKIYCVILGFILFLIAALRSTSVGNDSGQYAWHFYHLQQLDFQGIIDYYQSELGFYFLVKVLTFISSNHQIMFTFIGALYAYSISRFIYKYSKDPMVSFIMLIPMMYFAFSLTGLRQTFAISILLISIDYIIERRLIKYLLIVFLASLFHQSALLFAPAYIIKNREITFKKILLYLAFIPVVYFLRPFIIATVQYFLYSSYNIDLSQSAGGWTTLFVYILILITSIIFKSQLEKEDVNYSLFFSMMYAGTLIQMFVPLEPNIFRVNMYYNIASIILIPAILKTQKDKVSKLIAYTIFFVLMGVQYYMFTFNAAGVQPYKFFWQ
jgi:uncharacterized integral membrane protein